MAVAVAVLRPEALEVVLRVRMHTWSTIPPTRLDMGREAAVAHRPQVALEAATTLQVAVAVSCWAGMASGMFSWGPAAVGVAITAAVPAASLLLVTPVVAEVALGLLGESTPPWNKAMVGLLPMLMMNTTSTLQGSVALHVRMVSLGWS